MNNNTSHSASENHQASNQNNLIQNDTDNHSQAITCVVQASNSNHMVCHTLLPDHYNLVHTIVVAFSQEEWAVEISMWSRLHISPGFPPEKVPHGTSVCPSPHQQISSQHPSNWTDFFMSTEKRRHTALTSQYNRDHSLSIQSWVVYWQYW